MTEQFIQVMLPVGCKGDGSIVRNQSINNQSPMFLFHQKYIPQMAGHSNYDKQVFNLQLPVKLIYYNFIK